MGALKFLEEWYAEHCDGDWEHGDGIRLTTLDNPGWMLTVNLEDTSLEGQRLDWVRDEVSDIEWLHYRSDGREFSAACGARDLQRALEAFQKFAEGRLHT